MSIGLSKESARRIRRAVERDEMRPYGAQPEARPVPQGEELHPVQITSTTQTAGRYPGSLYQRDGNADTFTLLGTAGEQWIDTPNGETLTTGKYYYAKVTGVRTADERLIFETVSGTSSTSARVTKTTSEIYFATENTDHTIEWVSDGDDTGDFFDVGEPTKLTVRETGVYLVEFNSVTQTSTGGVARAGTVLSSIRFTRNGWGWTGGGVNAVSNRRLWAPAHQSTHYDNLHLSLSIPANASQGAALPWFSCHLMLGQGSSAGDGTDLSVSECSATIIRIGD